MTPGDSGAHRLTSRDTTWNRKARRRKSQFSNVETPNSEALLPCMFTFARPLSTRHRKLRSWLCTELQRGLDHRFTQSCFNPRPNFTVETIGSIFKSDKG